MRMEVTTFSSESHSKIFRHGIEWPRDAATGIWNIDPAMAHPPTHTRTREIMGRNHLQTSTPNLKTLSKFDNRDMQQKSILLQKRYYYY